MSMLADDNGFDPLQSYDDQLAKLAAFTQWLVKRPEQTIVVVSRSAPSPCVERSGRLRDWSQNQRWELNSKPCLVKEHQRVRQRIAPTAREERG